MTNTKSTVYNNQCISYKTGSKRRILTCRLTLHSAKCKIVAIKIYAATISQNWTKYALKWQHKTAEASDSDSAYNKHSMNGSSTQKQNRSSAAMETKLFKKFYNA